MNHAITIGGLLLIIGAIGGGLIVAFGGLMTFAQGMSDAPDDAGTAGIAGCAVFIAGAVVCIGCIVGLVL